MICRMLISAKTFIHFWILLVSSDVLESEIMPKQGLKFRAWNQVLKFNLERGFSLMSNQLLNFFLNAKSLDYIIII
jgi:hypothetical protein